MQQWVLMAFTIKLLHLNVQKNNSSHQCHTANIFSEYYTVVTETYIMFYLALTDAAVYYCLKRRFKKKYFNNTQQQEYAGIYGKMKDQVKNS